MKNLTKLLLAVFLVAPAAMATKVPIPIEGATLNVSFQLQTQFLLNENGAPNGSSNSYDIYVRRSRVLINGDINQNFTYLVQVDNPNFGKFGNFTGRALIQDAWIGWAPGGITGGTVFYIDAGILLMPISHHLLESTTNFIGADVRSDAFRVLGAYPNLRDTGVQVRGWLLDKKIGFRGGVYEGIQPIAAPAVGAGGTACGGGSPAAQASCPNPKRVPKLAGFVNFDIIGSEEGGWLYGAYRWNKAPVLSVGVAGGYQSLAVRNIGGNWTDQRYGSADVYLNLPMTEAAEFVAEVTGYRSDNGGGTGNTGYGFSAEAGYRFGPIAPYASYEYFQSDDCGGAAGCVVGASRTVGGIAVAGPDTADSRNFRVGLNFFFNKNLNHLNAEFSANHGQSAWGNTNITTGSAGYAPALASANLRASTNHSFLLHWNVLF